MPMSNSTAAGHTQPASVAGAGTESRRRRHHVADEQGETAAADGPRLRPPQDDRCAGRRDVWARAARAVEAPGDQAAVRAQVLAQLQVG